MHCHMLPSHPPAGQVSYTHCQSTNHRAEKVNHLPEKSRRDSFWKVWFLSNAHSTGWTMGRVRGRQRAECLVFQAAYFSQINTEWHPSANPIDVEDHYHSRQPLNQLLSSLMLMLFTYQWTGLKAFVCTMTKSPQQPFA